MQPLAFRQVKSGDAEIAYRVLGEGPPVVLLHPFPANHEFWLPVAEALSTRYRSFFPICGGTGIPARAKVPATMEKHAADIARVMDDADVGRAPLGWEFRLADMRCSNSGEGIAGASLRLGYAIRRRLPIPRKPAPDGCRLRMMFWSAAPNRFSGA